LALARVAVRVAVVAAVRPDQAGPRTPMGAPPTWLILARFAAYCHLDLLSCRKYAATGKAILPVRMGRAPAKPG
jgi:hypothetical protein